MYDTLTYLQEIEQDWIHVSFLAGLRFKYEGRGIYTKGLMRYNDNTNTFCGLQGTYTNVCTVHDFLDQVELHRYLIEHFKLSLN